jgi:hypothetical protein
MSPKNSKHSFKELDKRISEIEEVKIAQDKSRKEVLDYLRYLILNIF